MAQSVNTASSFSFKEVSGAKRVLHLNGRAAPHRPFVTRVRQRNDYTTLPGYSRANLTLLGPEDVPTRINGTWKDRWISPYEAAALEGHYLQKAFEYVDSTVSQLGSLASLGSAQAATGNPSVPVVFAGNRVNSARETVDIVDKWCRMGTLLEVSWDRFAWHGIIEELETGWLSAHDVNWDISFKWLGRAEQTAPSLLADEYGVNDTASLFQKLSDLLGLEALPPSFPLANDVFRDMNALLTRIKTTSGAIIDTVKGIASKILAPVNAVRRLVSLCNAIASQARDLVSFLKETFTPGNQFPRNVGLSVSAGQLAESAPRLAEPVIDRSFSDRMVVLEYTNRVAAIAKKITAEAVARSREYSQQLYRDLVTVHTVRAGEDLRSISQSAYGSPNEWRMIMSYNELTDPRLKPGQVILVPKTTLLEAC